ncbi:MAG: YjdF family protein [Thermomicrobiales bacterium]
MLLTVYFEGPFWVALAEQLDADGLRAVRHIFGEEPSDAAVLIFVLDDLFPLLDRAIVTVDAEPARERKRNPKRAAREAARAGRARRLAEGAQAGGGGGGQTRDCPPEGERAAARPLTADLSTVCTFRPAI